MKNAQLRLAAVFHAVAITGSLAAAAKRIGKSVPAVHHDIKLMEREFGSPLFIRAGRALRMNPAATDLFETISRSLNEIERSGERLKRGLTTEGTIRIAVVSGFGRYRLAPKLFNQARPGQAIELIMGSHEEVLEALLSRRVEAAVTYKPVSAIPITTRLLGEEDYFLIGPKDASVAYNITGIEELNFITYDEYEYVFAVWFESMFGAQPGKLRRLDHTTELEEAMESVSAGRGYTIVPADIWLNGPWCDRCVNIFPEAVPPRNSLFLLSLPGTEPAKIERLLDLHP